MAARTENPLQRGCSPEARSANIRELRGTGRPMPQAIRIAYEEQRRQGCKVPPAPRPGEKHVGGGFISKEQRLANGGVCLTPRFHNPAKGQYGGKGLFRLPVNHVAAVQVPKGGSCCANCRFVDAKNHGCVSPDYVRWNGGSGKLPNLPLDEICSDWWEPQARAANVSSISTASRQKNPKMAPVPTDPKLKRAYDLFAADFKKKSGGLLQNVSASYETKYDGKTDVDAKTGRIVGTAYYAGWSGEGQLYIDYVLEGGAPRIRSLWVSWDKLPAAMLPAATAMHRVARQVREDVLHAREGELDGGEFDKPPKVGERQFSVHAREGADTDLAWIMVFEPAVRAMRGGRKANPAPRVVAGEAVLNRELLALPGRRWRASAHVHVECDAQGYCVVVEAPGRGRQVHRAKNPAEAAQKARTVSLVAAGVVNPDAPKAPDRRGKPRANPVSSYEARLQAALLTPTRFDGRHVLEKLAQLPEDYLAIRNLALAELRARLHFPGAAEEVAEAQEAYLQALHRRSLSGEYGTPARGVSVEELRKNARLRRYFQGHLDLALDAATRNLPRTAETEWDSALRHARKRGYGWAYPQKRAAAPRRGNPTSPATSYEARLQAALLTPTKFEGRRVLEKLAQLPDPSASTNHREGLRPGRGDEGFGPRLLQHEPWAGYVSIRNRALAELRLRLGFPGAAEEVAEAQEAYVQALHQRIRLRDAGQHYQRAEHVTVEELRADHVRRRYFQERLDLALEAATRRAAAKAEMELKAAIKHGPPDLAALASHVRRAPAPRRRRNPTNVPREARYQAAVLTPKAFSGRKNLQQWAAQNHPLGDVYLAQLRVKLGFKGAEEELAEAKEALIQHDLKFAGEGKTGSGHGSVYGGGAVAYLTKEDLAVRSQTAQRLLAMPQRERVHWALQQDNARRAAVRAGKPLSNELISNLSLAGDIAKDELELREGKHQTRVATATAHRADPLAERTVGHGEREMIRARLRKTILLGTYPTRRVFRVAERSHEDAVVVVDPGSEKVVTSTDTVRTHRRHSWTALTSRHEWHVSRAILSEEVRALNRRALSERMVYLRPDLRVVQGRGTGLVMQKKTGARGGWS